jgi:hypothetical protein
MMNECKGMQVISSHIASLPRLLKSDQVSAIVSGKSEIPFHPATHGDTISVSLSPTEPFENQGFSHNLTLGETSRNKSENGARCRV